MRRRTLPVDGSPGNSPPSKYANSKSYLKSRRSAAKEERQGKILSFVDSSLNTTDSESVEMDFLSNLLSSSTSLDTPLSAKLPQHLSSSPNGRNKNRKSTSEKKHLETSQRQPSSPTTTEDGVHSSIEKVLQNLENSSGHDTVSTSMSANSLWFNSSENNICAGGAGESVSFADNDDDLSSSSNPDDDDHNLTPQDVIENYDEKKQEILKEDALQISLGDENSLKEIPFYEKSKDSDVEECVEENEIQELHHDENEEEIWEEEVFQDDVDLEEGVVLLSDEDEDEDSVVEFFEEEVLSEDMLSASKGSAFDAIEQGTYCWDDCYEEVSIAEVPDTKFESTLSIIHEEASDSDSSCEVSSVETLDDIEGFTFDDKVLPHNNDIKDIVQVKMENEVHWLEDEKDSVEHDIADVVLEEIVDPTDTGVITNQYEEAIVGNEVSCVGEELHPHFDVPELPAIVNWQKHQETTQLKEAPEVAERTPRSILLAVLESASVDFRLRKVPKEHKKRFVPTADAAASLGRLVRLKEEIVEGVGSAPTGAVKEDTWAPSGKPITLLRSRNLRLVNEAAAMGRLLRLKEKVVVNYKETNSFENEMEIPIEDMVDEKGYKIFRTRELVPRHVRDSNKQSMDRDWNVGILEEVTEAEETTVNNVKLPTLRVPRFHPTTTTLSRAEMQKAISRGVAEGAWDRRYRLERPQIELRITSMCHCKYCKHPNAYQTHAYKLMDTRTTQYRNQAKS